MYIVYKPSSFVDVGYAYDLPSLYEILDDICEEAIVFDIFDDMFDYILDIVDAGEQLNIYQIVDTKIVEIGGLYCDALNDYEGFLGEL